MRGRKNNQAVGVLNKLDLQDNSLTISGDNLPVGMREDPNNKLSCNFGTDRLPRRGGCYQGDSNGYITCGSILDLEIQNLQIKFWVKRNSYASRERLIQWQGTFGSTVSNGAGVTLSFETNGNILFYLWGVSSRVNSPSVANFTDNDWHLLDIKYYNRRLICTLDGTEVSNIQDYAAYDIYYGADRNPNTSLLTGWHLGNPNSIGTATMQDIEFNELDVSGNFVQNLAHYKCDENSGTVTYDSSGNGNHGTITDAVTVPPEIDPNSIHQYQDIYSWQNEVGYTLNDAGTYDILIPRDESIQLPPFKDAIGNDLQFIGKVPGRAAFKQSNCFEGDGTAYLTISGLLTTDTITVFGDSDTPTCTVNGRLDLGNAESAYGVLIERGGSEWAKYSLSEPIIDAANHTYHDVSGNGNHATLINGALANEGKQDEFHYSQLGITVGDGINGAPIGHIIPALASNISQDVFGNPIGLAQDGNSFLNTGTLLEMYNYPAVIQSEQISRFWTGVSDAVIDIEFSDFTGSETGGRVFDDISDTDNVKNIRTFQKQLTGKQLNLEKKLTNN